MIDGIYSITFRGRDDWGMGMLILQKGSILGADSGGAQFDGQYFERGPVVDVKMTMTVPPGATLVQGTKPQPFAYTIPVEIAVPTTAFANRQPVLMQLPPGPVNVIFACLRKI
jgi:hypothetical protein